MTTGTLTLFLTLTTLGLAVGLITFGFTRLFANGNTVHERIETYAVVPRARTISPKMRRRSRISSLRFQLNTVLPSLNSEKVALELLRANWRVTVTEFILIRSTLTAAGFLMGWLISGSTLPGVGLGLLSYLAPGILLRWRINKRQINFDKQLLDVLVLITGAVRAGFSLLQALELIVRELKEPASVEFGRVIHESSLGIEVPQALRNLANRMNNDDLNLIVTAIEIQYKVGGNMATMLSAVSETIRERIRLFGEVRVITTQQRYTGYLLSVLPFAIGGIMFMMSPDYMSRLFEPGPTLIIGHFAIQRIDKIDI
jgi:tight adherence protein B